MQFFSLWQDVMSVTGMIGWMKPALCDLDDVRNVKPLKDFNPRTAYFRVSLELT